MGLQRRFKGAGSVVVGGRRGGGQRGDDKGVVGEEDGACFGVDESRGAEDGGVKGVGLGAASKGPADGVWGGEQVCVYFLAEFGWEGKQG